MKYLNSNIKGVLFLIFLTVFTSCKNSFLEVTPKGKLIAQNTSDYDLLLNNLDLLNMNTNAQAFMGDEVAAINSYFDGTVLRTQRLFRWEDVIYESNEDAAEIEVPMANIYVYNKIINEVMDSQEGTEEEKKSLRAEALAGRAWTYFLLINYYGNPYSESSALTDLGFPIVTTADATTTEFSRATVQEVYDFIVNDLNAAIPDLPTNLTHRIRMSKAAGEGLLAKVYVFMGKFSEAKYLLDSSLTTLNSATISVGLYNYNETFATAGAFLPISTSGPTYPTVPNNEENIYAKQFSSISTYSSAFIVSEATLNLFDQNDLRRNFYSDHPYPSGDDYPNGLIRRMGPGTVQFGVILPELYLLRAECKARLEDLTGAVADLETLRTNRMPLADVPVPLEIASEKLPLLQFILDERIREFAGQGFRWFDMRRLSVDPLFSSNTYYHTLYMADGSIEDSYTLSAERLTLRLPQKVIDQNPGMENNP